MERLFSGMQPTQDAHIGNWLGAIRNWVALQDRYECLYCVVDLHALTAPYDPKIMRERVLNLAAAFLVRSGYRIVERNFRCPAGEIDLVAVEGAVLCFVEVKARTGTALGLPVEAVDGRKRQRMIRAAHCYTTAKRLGGVGYRYDVVSIQLATDPPDIQLLRSAFDEGAARGRRR